VLTNIKAPRSASPGRTAAAVMPRAPRARQQTVVSMLGLGLAALVALGSPGLAKAAAPVPPTAAAPTGAHSLIGFPQRDFISADGYTPGVAYTFSVIRGGNVISTSSPVTADATGLAEVNHPGGACWTGMTPNIQPGDTIRISGGGIVEQTTVAGVTDERPIVTSVDPVTGGGTIEVHGTAVAPGGGQLPLDQIEQRLVANRDAFDLNGRRTIRAANAAGEDGTLAYDSATSTRWTAKYTLQTPNDLARAVGGTSTSGASFDGSESRILWLGNNAAAGNELTIYENGPAVAGGPTAGIAGCTSGPAETPAPNVALPAIAPTFPTTAVNAVSAAQNVTITNSGTAPLHIDRAYLAGLNPGDYGVDATAVNGKTLAPGASATVGVWFKPVLAGTRQAKLSFADDGANTTDQTLTLSASTPAAAGPAGPVATAPVQSLAAVFNDPMQVFSPLANTTLPVDLKWTNGGGASELQMSTASSTNQVGATWTPVTLATASATSTRYYMPVGNANGQAYQFRVRGCNAGVCGAWATGPKFTLLATDDGGMAPGQFKGTWTSVASVTGAFGGGVRRAAGSGQVTLVPAVTYTVSGSAAWVSTVGPDQGLAQVQVDNGKPEVVDLYSPNAIKGGRVVWARDGLAAGTHTVTITALGKKSPLNPNACNTGAKCAQVDVDAAVMIK
jgi:hypothetical protein